jgi:hypothetical protein
VGTPQCSGTKPICENQTCRSCELDSECESGACGRDGACVDQAAVVYVDGTGGLDAGTCVRSGPCKTLAFGIGKFEILIHATGAQIGSQISSDPIIDGTNRPYTLIGASLMGLSSGPTLVTGVQEVHLAHLKLTEGGTIDIGGIVIARDLQIVNSLGAAAITVRPSGNLSLDGGTILGGQVGILGSGIVGVQNLLISETSGRALDLTQATGSVQFTTIADSGISGTSPCAVSCGPGVHVDSSIIWTSCAGAPVNSACQFSSTIVGPTALVSTMNTDPLFAGQFDYHIQPSSPAKDAVDTGPNTDFEGDPRPRGARYDIGADEAP